MPTLKTEDRKTQPEPADDPVLQMLGVGRGLWEHESGDNFIERLRSEKLTGAPSVLPRAGRAEDLMKTVWSRIEKYQGEPFHTATGLLFTYELERNGVWFFRNRKRINRKLARTQVEVAISRCPLRSTTEIKDLIDYPYLFALLRDPRIREQAW